MRFASIMKHSLHQIKDSSSLSVLTKKRLGVIILLIKKLSNSIRLIHDARRKERVSINIMSLVKRRNKRH